MALFVNRLTHLDVSIWCPERGLVGCSWQVDVVLDGTLGSDGMLFDFGEVKPWIKRQLDGGIDHTLLVPIDAPGVEVETQGDTLSVSFETPYPLRVSGPRQAFSLLPWARIDTEALSRHLSDELHTQRPVNVEGIRLALHAERTDAAYGYSHGLKFHAGNCQRIAHGHRSRLEIWQENRRQPGLESEWISWLDNRYFIDASNIVAEESDTTSSSELTCRYTSSQGEFSLTLPKERCVIMPWPTTVENIARHLAKRIAEKSAKPTHVVAFEGIDKGATARALP